MRDIISRFAPAPTGFLHLGHVVNALYVWGIARRHGGRVLLRIEDHDRQRSRRAYEDAIVEDLAWLGFAADSPLVRQSERGEIYARALDRLRAQGLVYACSCSRSQIAAAYPGTCRERGLADGPGSCLRVRLDPSVERFVDRRHGPQEQRPSEQCGDLVVRDRDGNWTYQFAVTVDDMEQGVTLVIRGDDVLDSAGRQLQLARLLGRSDPPRFLHHPLIMKSAASAEGFGAPGAASAKGSAGPEQKLSKSDGDTGVRDLRAAGWTPERVLGRAAFLAGSLPEARDIRVDELSTIISFISEGL